MSASLKPKEFVAAVQPVLERRDLPGLLALLKSRWTPGQIVSLLACDDCDARKVAALSLSLVGGDCCLDDLAQRLRDPDPMVNQMAEHAMWSIWFRGGTPQANHQLCRGAEAISRGDYEHAIRHFNNAIYLCPSFPEAYNQRGLAACLLERYEDSIDDCRRAVEMMPIHFGAWAGMGHSHAHRGEMFEAVACYERALAINPHLREIRQAVEELRLRLGQEAI